MPTLARVFRSTRFKITAQSRLWLLEVTNPPLRLEALAQFIDELRIGDKMWNGAAAACSASQRRTI